MKIPDKIKETILKKMSYDVNIQDLDVKMKDKDVEITFKGNATIPRKELVKLLFKA